RLASLSSSVPPSNGAMVTVLFMPSGGLTSVPDTGELVFVAAPVVVLLTGAVPWPFSSTEQAAVVVTFTPSARISAPAGRILPAVPVMAAVLAEAVAFFLKIFRWRQ